MKFYLGKKSDFCVEIDGVQHTLFRWKFPDIEIIYFEINWHNPA